MRYDDAVNGTNKWIEHNQAVKVNWPNPKVVEVL